MTTGLIELSDTGIRYLVEGELLGTHPGYAVLDGETLLLGKTARESAKLLPSWTNNKFWSQLSVDPIKNATHHIRHHADLAFAQLEQIHQGSPDSVDQLLISVPSFFDRDQLGLLLGITKEANLPIVGLVDASLLSVIGAAAADQVLFLDISLHKISLTTMKLDQRLRVNSTHTISETGLSVLWDRWASILSNQFIQSSRFDPMHNATSEQKLFDLLPEWISRGAGTFELEIAGVTHTTRVTDEQLLAACSSIYPNIVQAIRQTQDHQTQQTSHTELFVSHHFDGFPNLIETLSLIPNLSVYTLPADSSAKAAMANWQQLTNDAGSVSFTTSLTTHTKPQAFKPTATHLLVGYNAYPIGQQLNIASLGKNKANIGLSDTGFTLQKTPTAMTLSTTNEAISINHQSIEGAQKIHPGDVIQLDNIEATLISAV